MKRLILWLALLLPFFANAQVNGTIQKTISTGTVRGNFGSNGLDTLPRVTGVLIDGYILKYHAATNKWYASPDGYIAGLQDSLTKKANRTFDNVASGAIANIKLANSTISGVALGSNLNALTLGNGLTGTSYNGSANVTATTDTAVVQTVSNFFPKGDTRYQTLANLSTDLTASATKYPSVNAVNTGLGLRLPLTGGTLTGGLIGTSATFNATGNILNLQRSGATNANWAFSHNDSGGNGYLNLSNVSTSKSIVNFSDNGAIGFNTVTPHSLTNYRFISTSDVTGGGLVMQKAGVNKGVIYSFNDNVGLESTSGLFMSVGGVLGAGISGLEISAAGVVKIPQLTGSVTDMMVIDNAGNVSRQAIPSGAGGGTVTSVGVSSANGFAGTSSGGANPALTLTTTVNGMVKANGTALSAATAGTDYTTPSGTENLSNKTITGSTISGYMPTSGGTFSGQVGINVGSSNVSDFDQLFLTNGGENGSNLLWNNAFGNLAGITGTKIGSGVSADEGQLIFKTANNSVLSTGMTLNNSGNLSVVGTIGASNFSGSSSGTNTGDQTTITGNAGTATALQTARNIQGVSFNGTADINPINGTGFVKASGTTLSYDNSTYLTTSSAASTYAPLNSPTFTGTPSLPTGTTGVTQTQGDNSTKIATTAYADGVGNTVIASQKQIANIYTNTSTTGTTTETLFTSNIAQSNLSADGDRIDFNFAGSFGLNANDKFVYLLIGGNTIAVSGNASSKSFWECEGYLMRTSSTTFRLFIRKAVDYVYSSAIADYTVTDFNPLTFSVLGQTNNASFPVTVQMGYLQSKKAP